MKDLILLLFLVLFLASCQNPNPQLEKELSETKGRLAAAESALEKRDSTAETPLVHEVYFNVKNDLNAAQKDQLYQAMYALKNIPVVRNLVVGDFKNLDDPRALADYEIKMSMEFKSEKDYVNYQAHPIHLTLKETASNLLAAPPVTYDFIKK